MFGSKKLKTEIEQLKIENQNLLSMNKNMEAMLTPEMKDAQKLKMYIADLEMQKQATYEAKTVVEKELADKHGEIASLDRVINDKKKQIIELDDSILFQDFGIYTPVYDLMNSEAYKDRIAVVRQNQKLLIKNDTACFYPTTMTLDGSLSKGKKMIRDNVKQILRSFNNECDAVIDKVKFNNIESIRKKIEKSFNDLNKMNTSMQISIVPQYLSLKLEELNLCHEYAVKKQEEKEEQKEIRERLREEAKLQKEIEEARKEAEKERKHYKNALKQVEEKLATASDLERKELEEKKKEIIGQLGEIEKSIEQIDYREANKRAGYVYIVSNIGSFGENVYKIGMTRRLEPLDRVDELGGASVPFNFDIHAMIFSDDAPSLENALHKTFENRKLNMINQRREFFNVTLEEIEEAIKATFDKTVDFTKLAPAEQYRESLMIKKQLQ